ncbi:MAG: hypothetical protein ACD_75C00668G0002 [uncultured bacterium]|nr:MAG: hypothetical protein ACD_75C00668G0002 [uncultured bacterium]
MAMLGRQGRKPYFMKYSSAFPDTRNKTGKRVAGVHLVMPVGSHQEEVGVFPGIGEYIGQKIERGRVAPLQVVDEKGQRVLFAGETRQKSVEEVVKPVQRFHRWQRLHRWLRSDQDFQLGNHIGQHLAVFAHRHLYFVFPYPHSLVAFGQKGAGQIAECLDQGIVRDVLLVEVEFA